LNDSLGVQDGKLVYRSPSFLDTSINTTVFRAVAGQNFPCWAAFDGNYDGAPAVSVPYKWCRDNCDGWEISHRDPSEWIGPLVGFILPCVAFVLNIPRSWKMQTPRSMWKLKPWDTMQFLSYVVQMPIALLAVTVDVITWLSICFAFAGPMLLSTVYEAYFDNKLLDELDRVVRDYSTSVSRFTLSQELRAKLLYVVLVGNIKFPEG
jgi:hypothetical protein